MLGSSRNSLFQKAAKALEEFLILFRFILRLTREVLEEALRQKAVQLLDQGAVLHRLA